MQLVKTAALPRLTRSVPLHSGSPGGERHAAQNFFPIFLSGIKEAEDLFWKIRQRKAWLLVGWSGLICLHSNISTAMRETFMVPRG